MVGETASPSLENAQPGQCSWVADTPGFNVMEFMQSDPRDVAGEFPEIAELSQFCKFSDCLHTVESNCAVLAAVEEMERAEAGEEMEAVTEPGAAPGPIAGLGAGPGAGDGAGDDEQSGARDSGRDYYQPEDSVDNNAEFPKTSIVASRYQSYCIMVAEAQDMQAAAKSVSTKKESAVKNVGGEDAGKVRIIPRLAGRYRAASRKTEKQKLPKVEDFDDQSVTGDLEDFPE